MMRCFSVAMIAGILAVGFFGGSPTIAAPGADSKGRTCTMEQQCHWENFKKICTWVKVCR